MYSYSVLIQFITFFLSRKWDYVCPIFGTFVINLKDSSVPVAAETHVFPYYSNSIVLGHHSC